MKILKSIKTLLSDDKLRTARFEAVEPGEGSQTTEQGETLRPYLFNSNSYWIRFNMIY